MPPASISLPKCEPPRIGIPRRLSCLFSSKEKDHNDNAYIYSCWRAGK